jgi:hypothetical protein
MSTKICIDCNQEIDINNFYKSNKNYYLSYCKPCHNLKRKTFKTSFIYTKKTTGFLKLPLNIREEIKKSLNNGENCTKIYEKLKNECVALKYNTLSHYIRTNQII